MHITYRPVVGSVESYESEKTYKTEARVLDELDSEGGRQIEIDASRDVSSPIGIVSKKIIQEGVLRSALIRDFRAAIQAVGSRYEIDEFLYSEDEIATALESGGKLLDVASRLALEGREPMIPPLTGLTRNDLFRAIDSHLEDGQTPSLFGHTDDDHLWGSEHLPISIVEGSRDVAGDWSVLANKWNNHKVEEAIKVLSERGMEPIPPLLWLHAAMVKLVMGEMLACHTSDILNPREAQGSLKIPAFRGAWRRDGLTMNRFFGPHWEKSNDHNIRVRASASVDTPSS